MNKNELLSLLKETGAILEGHFLLTSGLHSDLYIEKFRIFQYPELSDKISGYIANHFSDQGATVVAGAAVGSIIFSHAVARHLGVRNIFAERVDGRLTFRRGFEVKPAEKVLVVEDIVTTGGSVKELIELIYQEGGNPVGLGILVNRSEKRIDFKIPTYSLLEMPVKAYLPDECPLCKQNIPLTVRGRSGKK